jgi:HlyD family secretion protein
VRNAPTTVQNVVTYDVPVGVDNTDLALKPGMTATVTITTARRDDVLKIPVRALRFRPEVQSATPAPAPPASHDGPHQGGGRARPSMVWVVPHYGELRPVEVLLCIRIDQEAELVSGDLRPGDRLAVAFQREPARAAERPRLPAGPRFR